ncbi:MAG: lycopene cyclase [Actinophytocola sp.]|uniref:lycopene cyclase family protein n=1 Tax=Actinophytocola sp. TaxID=1872138 RepID=UPI001325879D|nr:lycopene cyclase family protein [Actinophytocola sp.]MPZ82746.1 lycopene cyclase [Actinophytocola sp.]
MFAADVVVSGAGPAGWAAARACAARGLRTALVAPRPFAPWPATYGMWLDEAPLLPPGAGYVVARARVVAGGSRWLDREYAVLDNASVRAALAHPAVEVRTGRLVDGAVELTGGGTVEAPVVIDATGARARGGVEQTAFGFRVPAEVAAPLVGPGEAVFMDWRQPLPGPPTFLYAIPLPDGRVLLEETSLARRPGLPFADLRSRLLARLAAHGIDPGDAEVERVRFPLDLGPPAEMPASRARAWCPSPTRSRGAPLMPVYRSGVAGSGVARGLWTSSGREWRVVPFGAAAGLVHPATGYSIADSVRLAPLVAEAIASGGARAARRVVWSPEARAVHRLRRAGLRALLALGPGRTEELFSLFFALPANRQRAYLSGREDLAGTVAAMAGLFRVAPWGLRRVLAFGR